MVNVYFPLPSNWLYRLFIRPSLHQEFRGLVFVIVSMG